MATLYLASSSPRRYSLLCEWGFNPQVIPNLLLIEDLPPTAKLTQLKKKMKALAKQKAILSSTSIKGIVIAADTTIFFKNKVLGKPKDLNAAQDMLSYLSGNRHQVITSVSILDTLTKFSWNYTVTTKVVFRNLSQKEITAYTTNYDVLDKAGSYAIQDIKDQFIEHIEGSVTNIIGLPQHPLCYYLNKLGVERSL